MSGGSRLLRRCPYDCGWCSRRRRRPAVTGVSLAEADLRVGNWGPLQFRRVWQTKKANFFE